METTANYKSGYSCTLSDVESAVEGEDDTESDFACVATGSAGDPASAAVSFMDSILMICLLSELNTNTDSNRFRFSPNLGSQ